MIRSTRTLVVALLAGGLALSCDEGRLVTDVETEPFEPVLEALTGPDTLFIGQRGTFSTAVRVGDETVTADVLNWDASPAGLLAYDTAFHGNALSVEAKAPGTATVTASVNHPDLLTASDSEDVVLVLLGVAPVRPAAGDTVLTALGDTLTVRARGIGQDGVSADSAGLTWTKKGAATTAVPPLTGRDAVVIEGVAVGTDTLIFRQDDNLCVQGQCVDTMYIHVQPSPARVAAQDTLRLGTLGSTATPTATVFDRNDNPISGAGLTWALASPGDTVRIGLASDGTVTARANGTARVVARAGTASDTVRVVVHQVIRTLTVSGDVTLDAIGTVDTLTATATDSGGSAVTRSFTVEWLSRDPGVATAARLSGGRGVITAVGAGSTRVVAEAEEVSDSAAVTVAQVVAGITFDPASDTINAIGDTLTLSGQAVDANGQPIAGVSLSWSPANPSVVDTVDAASGRVVSAATGSAYVRATADAVTDSILVVSRQVAEQVTISPATPAGLVAGDTVHLSASAADSNGVAIPGPTIQWQSRDTTVATVDANGVVTGQPVSTEDTTFIVAATGGATDSVQIVVAPASLASVTVTPDSVRIVALGATAQLNAQGLNQNGSAIPGETFTWASRNTAVATVNASGNVTSVSNGQTWVVATSDTDPGLLDSAKVVVEQVVANVALVPAVDTFTAHSQTHVYTARATDANGQYVPAAVFTFSDDLNGLVGIAATSDTTANVTSQTNGSGEVYATETGTGSGVADTTAIVVKQVPAAINVTPAATTITLGTTGQLAAEVTDANGATITGASVAWRVLSTDTAIAAVDGTGTVTGKAVGVARVVANPTGNASIADTSNVTVAAYSLGFDGTDDYAEVTGDPLDLTARTTWTVELWVRPGANAGDVVLLGKGYDAAQNDTAYAVLLRDRRPVLVTHTSAGAKADRTTEFDVGSALTQDVWAHVAFVYDNGTAELFVDGVSQGTGAVNEPADSDLSLFLGAATASAGFFDGDLDEIRFWSTARTAAEISGNKDATLAVNADMLAYWTLDDAAGNAEDLVSALVAALGAGGAAPTWTTASPFN